METTTVRNIEIEIQEFMDYFTDVIKSEPYNIQETLNKEAIELVTYWNVKLSK